MGKRELVAMLSLSSWCLMIVVWLFLAVPWVCLQFLIVVFPNHTHSLFLIRKLDKWCVFYDFRVVLIITFVLVLLLNWYFFEGMINV